MSVTTGATDLQLMAVDQPVPVDSSHIGVISGPKRDATAVAIEKMQGLYIGAGARGVTINGGELRAEQMLGTLILFEGTPHVINPGFTASVGSRAEIDDFDILCEARTVAFPVPSIHAGDVLEHQVLQFNSVAGVVMWHGHGLYPVSEVSPQLSSN